MAEESFDEKTEPATPHKRREVREKGEVAKSRELVSVVVLLAALTTLAFWSTFAYRHMQSMMQMAFTLPTFSDLHLGDFMQFAEKNLVHFLWVVGPMMAAAFVMAVFANIMQIGFLITGEQIKPKLSKLDPIKGAGRLLSKQALMELFKSLLKLALVGVVAYFAIKDEIPTLPLMGEMEIATLLKHVLTVIFKIMLKCTLAMVLLVVIDYAYQKWDFEKRIKMTHKEVKEEFKKTEGDPQVKSRIKSIQMQMARKRMMAAVPEADVVITNPTHYAVALKYDPLHMGAPKLVAKGAGKIAQRIKALAEAHHIPVIENKGLAQNLYKLVEIGNEIPPALYQAVAEVLAYLYTLKRRPGLSG